MYHDTPTRKNAALRLSLLAALLGLALLSCKEMFFFRSSADYFPLVDGSEWKYLLDTDTTYVKVAGDSLVANRTCIVVNVDDAPEFWLREPTQARKFFRRTLSRGGAEYPLEERYGLVYIFPLVLGSSWREVFRDTVVILGTDTVHYYRRLEATVSELADINTPAGSFLSCYRLDFSEEVRADDTTFSTYSEWLAPGVGVVRTDDRELVHYRIGP